MALTVRNAQQTLENLLRDTILKGLRARLPAVASITELRALPTRGEATTLRDDDDLISVVDTGQSAYRWSQTSSAPDDPPSVIIPDDVDPSTNGRWLLWTSPIRFVQVEDGDSYTLDQLPLEQESAQPLRSVILLDKPMSPEELLELCFGQTPAVCITAEGDDPDELTQNSGHRWSDSFRFSINIVADGFRDYRQPAMGSDVSGETQPGANTIDALIWILLAGTGAGRLTEVVPEIRDVRAGKAENWNSDLAQRLVIRSREYIVIATLENPQAPNDTGPAQMLTQQAQMTDLGEQDEIDLNNIVTGGLSVPLSAGLVKPVAAGTAIIGGVEVDYAGELHTFDASADTYRDLNPDGTMAFTSVPVGDPPPDLAAGAMRIGVTTTDGSGVVSDLWIAARKIDYMNPIETDLS